MKKPLRLAIAALVVLGLGLVVGPWVYINLIKDDAPEALSLTDSQDTTATSVAVTETLTDANGEWSIASGSDSVVGYRVKEVLFGQDTEGVGRTKDVTGSLTIADNTVSKATFTVQMGTITSDAAKRDAQFNGRIMDVASYPTATFTLTQPIELPSDALSGDVITARAVGELTLRGMTKPVAFDVEAQVTGNTFTVVGDITVVFDEWNIPEPGFGGITVEPQGLLEFSLVFSK
jgi:polyisoprenoid-binding protein YceI